MEIYFNPYPGAAKSENDGIQYAVQAANALTRLKKELQSIQLNGRFGEGNEVKPTQFMLVRSTGADFKLNDVIYKIKSPDRENLILLLQTFSHGKVLDTGDLEEVNNWIIAHINVPAPVLALAAKNGAIALTIPTEEDWRKDLLYFKEQHQKETGEIIYENKKEILYNLWGQEHVSAITGYCIESLANSAERFSTRFNVKYCTGALNSAPPVNSWDNFGYFAAMKKAKERNYKVDGDLVKNENMPKTEKYGSLLELRMMASGHRIFFVHRLGLNPEILIGGFYQKNQSASQNDAIQKAKGRIDDYND
jgi:hypothetical protein